MSENLNIELKFQKSKILIMALCITVLCILAFSITASAAETDGYYTYTVTNGKATIFNNDPSISGDVIIPAMIGGYPVTSIGNYAFDLCENITSITIPDGVTSIGGGAFYECVNLTSITIPNGVTSIGGSAFRSCERLTNITIPDSVIDIGTSAFRDCKSLTDIEIPYRVTSIKNFTFDNCINLTNVSIPNAVTSIGSYAFYNCKILENIKIPDGVTYIGNDAFSDCISLTSITIPDGVTYIGNNAFSDCISLTSITIPKGVTNIGYRLFSGCSSLTSIEIPDGVTYIETSAFSWCESLTSITIPASVTSIGERAFYNCYSLTSITIPDSVTSIGDEAFYNCDSLTSITIPGGVTSIGEGAFSNCDSLTSITIPDSVTSIGGGAFYNCDSLTSITIPDSVTSIGEDAFSHCESLTSITIPDSVTSIGYYAFYYCPSLTSITIPDSVTSIGDRAFSYCESLTSITIGNSVTSIGYYAFCNCYSLTDVYYRGSEEAWANISIGSYNSELTNATIHYNYGGNNTSSGTYEPSTNIDIDVKIDPSYMPSGINNVTINGKGTAYGRFKILNDDGSVARNKKVHYSIDSDMERTTNTDEYGFAVIKIPQITKSKDYIVSFSGNGIYPISEELKVTVEPLHFKSGIETSIEKGVSVGAGLGVGAELGSLEAKAGVASVGADGAAKNTLNFEQEFVNNKHKVTISSKTNYSLAAEAKLGLFAEASEKNVGSVSASAAELHGKGSASIVYGVGFEDEDFNINDKSDMNNFSKFMLSALVGTQTGNVTATIIADAIEAPVNSYELGTVFSLSGGAQLLALETGNDNVSAGVKIGGIDGASIWTANNEFMADNSVKYSSSVTTQSGTALFNMNIGFEDEDDVNDSNASTGSDAYTNFVKDNLSVSAERDPDFNLKKLSFSSKEVDETSILLYKKVETDNETITYSGEAAKNIADVHDNLGRFSAGKKVLFSKKQLENAMEFISNSKESASFSRTKSVEEEYGLDLSAKFQIGLKLGAKLGIAGVVFNEYEKENGIFENGTYYMQAKNDIESEVDDLSLDFGKLLDSAGNAINTLLDKVWETVKGAADQAIEYGQALVKKAADKVTGWAVSITKAVSPVKSMSILAVEDEFSLFSTSSLATTIGEPYIITVEDENGNEVTDFSENPFVLTLTYTDSQLADAGVTELDTMSVVMWDDAKGAYVKLGGTLDEENSCMTLEITKPGQYILAVDNCPPAITQFGASDNGSEPKISAIVSDMSGIANLTFSIDEEIVVDNNNLDEHYNFATGEFEYQTKGLSEGEHTAVIYAADSFGNEITKEFTFSIDTAVPVISNVTDISDMISESITVCADVSGENLMSVLLNAEITDIYGNSVKKTVDMIETDGTYSAVLPKIENAHSVNVWVSAYSKSGNKAESEKQQTIMIKSEGNIPSITITKITDGNITVTCTGIDSIENGKIYVATYDESGKLAGVKSCDLTDSKTIEISKAHTVKAFIWDGIKPLCKSALEEYKN